MEKRVVVLTAFFFYIITGAFIQSTCAGRRRCSCVCGGALGMALGSMVGNLTLGKKKYKDVEEDIKELMENKVECRLKEIESGGISKADRVLQYVEGLLIS